MKNLQKTRTYLKEKGMGKNKFGEFLRKLLGGIREKTITTYDESGEIIEVATVTTRLSYFEITCKLFIGLMIFSVVISILLSLYSFFILPYNFFRPTTLFWDIMFLMFFMWLYSMIGND